MEKQKAEIEQKAEAQVRGELYCGWVGVPGAYVLGTESCSPYASSSPPFHFAWAYPLPPNPPLRATSKTKQRKLIRAHNFDIQKYNKLCHCLLFQLLQLGALLHDLEKRNVRRRHSFDALAKDTSDYMMWIADLCILMSAFLISEFC
ncbi:hypothetical protein V6N12_071177 [Hibiscus sabdariffa]|uniref:Uncharacterized protein n=1 Tax=Hibiscus sabdariffa TaxID=183260 RepID=A0ABR2FJ58_9ROSI